MPETRAAVVPVYDPAATRICAPLLAAFTAAWMLAKQGVGPPQSPPGAT